MNLGKIVLFTFNSKQFYPLSFKLRNTANVSVAWPAACCKQTGAGAWSAFQDLERRHMCLNLYKHWSKAMGVKILFHICPKKCSENKNKQIITAIFLAFSHIGFIFLVLRTRKIITFIMKFGPNLVQLFPYIYASSMPKYSGKARVQGTSLSSLFTIKRLCN